MDPTGDSPIAADDAGDAATDDPARAAVESPAATGPQPGALQTPAPHTSDAQQLHGNRVATGLTPLVWGAVVVIGVLVVLIWQLT